MKRLLLALIRGYRKYISPARPPCCRFIPTCSAYALEAVEKYGAWKGGLLALRRLLEHPEEARQMGENGRRAVREAFNWSVEEQTLLGLYRDLSGSCDKGR